MGREAADINSPPFTGDDILGLLNTLRRDGFAIGMDEYLDVQDILTACSRYDSSNKTSLRNWLSPVLCTNAEEQRLFYQRFESWWSSLSPEQPLSDRVVPDGWTPFDDEVEHLGWGFWSPLVALATLALAVSWFAIKPVLEDAITVTPEVCQQALPQLVNLMETNARQEIEAAGLVVGDVSYNNNDTTDKGHVVNAVWQADAEPLCRFVSMTVSEGRAEAVLPEIEVPIVQRNYELQIHGRVMDHRNNAIGGARVIMAPGRYFSDARELPENAATVVGDEIGTTDEGFPYLEDFRALGGADIVFVGHDDSVQSSAFSPDGSQIVTASADGTTRVWNADGLGEPLILRGHEGMVWSAAFSPDGRRIVTASEDGTARVWNANGFGDPLVLRGHEGVVWSAVFSPDGGRIVTASDDGTARVWNADGSEEPLVLRGHEGPVLSAAFSPGGLHIATGSIDGSVGVWSVDGSDDSFALALIGHEDFVRSVAYSPDGSRIVTASGDGTARVWNANGSGEPLVLKGHKETVWSVAYSPDGSHIVSASADGTARVWNTDNSGGALVLRGHEEDVVHATFSPDGSRIVTASANGTARIWQKGNILETQHWTETDADGKFDLNPAFYDDAALIVSHDDHKSALQLDGLSDPASVQFEVEMVPLAPSWLRTLERVIFWVAFTLISLVLVLGVYRWYRNRKFRDIVLEHRAERNVTSVAEVNIAEPPHTLYHGADFIHARTAAYRREQHGSGGLDEDATIDQSVRRLGYFTPVYRSRLQLPNYLALIDRANFGDQQACLVGEFIDRLLEGGVSVDRYFFDRDPRVCASSQDAGVRHRSLRELAARHPGYRLLIFSDGQGLAHPFAGGLARWIELLDAWPERVLMTPVPAYHWSRREIGLTASGLLVLPATPGGLQRFVEHITQPEVATPLPGDWSPAFPESIELEPSRWLERNAPPEDDQSEMLRQIRGYLGNDSCRWLSALAVYPELKWYITLYLGLELKRKNGESLLDEEALLNLTRLPWLRHGVMPDWMREKLIASLSPEDEQAVRNFLYRLLRNPLEDQQSRLQLNIARSGEQRKQRRWSQIFKQLLVSEPDDSPLQDAVFVEFLSGKRPGRLQFLVPQKWHRLLYNKGVSGLGLKPSAGGLLALAACLGIMSAGIVLHAAAGEIFSPAEPSMIKEVDKKTDNSVQERFDVQNPTSRIDEDSQPVFNADGYSTNRCLRECEARQCVAAEIVDDQSCRLFASYKRIDEDGPQNMRVYLAQRVPVPAPVFSTTQSADSETASQGESLEEEGNDLPVLVEVPDFLGRSLADVRSIMEDSALVLGDTVYVEKVSAQEARVVAQTPVAGSMVGSGIQVVLSMGLWEPQQVQAPANNTGPDSLTDPLAPTTFPMPDIIGLTIAEAERMVLSAGQNAGATSARASIARRQAGSLPAGQIILQQDELGKQMRPYSENVRGTPGEVVFRVVISSGEDTRTFLMPNVIGLTVTEAERRVLSEARSTRRATSARAVIARRQADARPAGQIIRQLEAPGTPLRPHMDDVSGTYGEVSFRVVVSSGEDRRTDNRDEIDPLDEYVADRLRNSVVVVRSSRELQAVRSLSRYFLMEEPPTGTAGNRLTYTQSTAFFVSEDGLMITTPLPPDSTSVTVQLPSGRSGVPVFSVLLSREFNLEAIAIEGFSGDVNTLELNGPDPERGTPVYLLGYALNTDWRLASGRVTGQAELSNGQRGIVTSIDHRDGFSGAPVVDQKGLLVGVAQSGDASGKVVVIPVEQAAYFRKEVSRVLRDYAD